MCEDTHGHHHLSAKHLLQIIQPKQILPINATQTDDWLIVLATLIFRRRLSLSSDQVLLWRGILREGHHRAKTSTDTVQTHTLVRKQTQKRPKSNQTAVPKDHVFMQAFSRGSWDGAFWLGNSANQQEKETLSRDKKPQHNKQTKTHEFRDVLAV